MCSTILCLSSTRTHAIQILTCYKCIVSCVRPDAQAALPPRTAICIKCIANMNGQMHYVHCHLERPDAPSAWPPKSMNLNLVLSDLVVHLDMPVCKTTPVSKLHLCVRVCVCVFLVRFVFGSISASGLISLLTWHLLAPGGVE